MSETAPIAAVWQVRAAGEQDVVAVSSAVADLLVELGGALVGVIAASWQTAIHIPGRYALIQDLWVHPAWRSREIGADLVRALCGLASDRQIARIEVGLPRESFAGLDATESFYARNGFTPLGPRMRRVLP